MNDLVKIHTYYIYSLLEAFTTVFYRGIDQVPLDKPVEERKGDGQLNDGACVRCVVLTDSITVPSGTMYEEVCSRLTSYQGFSSVSPDSLMMMVA